MYDKDALQQGIDKAQVNIKTFETAIEGERQTIKEYRIMIDEIEVKEAKEKAN